MSNESNNRRVFLGGLFAGAAALATAPAFGKGKDEYDILIERYNAVMALPKHTYSDNLSEAERTELRVAALPVLNQLFDHMLTAFPIPMGEYVPPSTIRTAEGDNDLTLVRDMLNKPSIDATNKNILMSMPRWMVSMTVTKAIICNGVNFVPHTEGFKRFCAEGGALYILS